MLVTFILVGINQIKCNFCHNWIEGPNLSRKAINACKNCLQKYREKENEVRTQSGEVYKMVLLSQQQHQGMSVKRLIEHFQEIKQSEIEGQIDQNYAVRSIIEAVEDFNHLQNNLAPSQPIKQSNDTTADDDQSFLRPNSQSMLIDQIIDHQNQIYLSFAQDSKNDSFNQSKLNKRKVKEISDLCPNLARTRFAQRYQFYYDKEQIKNYQQRHRKLQRTFGNQRVLGTEASNVFASEQFVHLKLKEEKMLTYRSTTSVESLSKSQKLTEEELKYRIDCYLDQRYHSLTLHRLMATYVKQAYHKTRLQGKVLQLISFDISAMDLLCYLNLFEFDQINTVKLIKVNLTDDLLQCLVEAIRNKPVERIVVSCNKLTENSLPVFLNRSLPYLKEIYLGKNRINKYRMKQNILQLRRKFILYL